MKKLFTVIIVAVSLLGVSGCGGSDGTNTPPAESGLVKDTPASQEIVKKAKNVEKVDAEGPGSDFYIFETEYQGETLICTTKPATASGVNCFKK